MRTHLLATVALVTMATAAHAQDTAIAPAADSEIVVTGQLLNRVEIAKASVAVMRNATMFVEAQNLTDEPTRQYQAGNKDWLVQNERYGRTFYLGASAKF